MSNEETKEIPEQKSPETTISEPAGITEETTGTPEIETNPESVTESQTII